MNFDLALAIYLSYPGYMNGLAEQHNGLSRKLRDSLEIGHIYTLEYMSQLLGWQSQASKGKGVLSPSGSDAQILLMHLEKDKYSTQEYSDHLYGTTLFWSGQNKIKSTERALIDGSKDTFIFIQEKRKTPYYYYGRAIPLRMQIIWEPGKPSHIAFDLPEYADYLKIDKTLVDSLVKEPAISYADQNTKVPLSTEGMAYTNIRTAQSLYRTQVINYWDGKCAVTGVDETGWLIASHIKPWRESSNEQRIDPHNGLLLTPNYDKLFDRGVISFSPSDGRIILPESQSRKMWNNFSRMHIDDSQKLRHMDDKIAAYLEYHNHYVYQFEPNDNISMDNLIDSIVAKAFI